MRLLCLSLLRAGDALVQARALANLADGGVEVHLLLQPAARPALELLAQFAEVHLLPRDFTGGALALEEVTPPLPSFDRVLNLTLTRSAAELAARIAARQPGLRVEGISLREGGAAFTSPWLQLLNDWGTSAQLSVLHYADVFARAVSPAPRAARLRSSPESEAFWTRARAGLPEATPIALLQTTTSEAKKSYPRARFLELAGALAHARPDAALFVLGAPHEAAALRAFSEESGGAVRPLPCTLAQAARALEGAQLLISADTALVHLAALCEARVLLLSSGSSAFRELGPARPGDLVLQANVPCAPCAHDASCLLDPGGAFPCTSAVPPLEAAAAAAALLAGTSPALPSSSAVRAYLAARDRHGLITYAPLGPATPADLCAALLRAHLLARLGLAQAEEPAPTPLDEHSRGALESLSALLDGLLLRANGGGRAPLDEALRSAREFVLLELARKLAARLQSAPGAQGAALREELSSLRARARSWLA